MKNFENNLIKFKENDFQTHKTLFKRLEKSQKPHTLFIGCSDSRVVPSLITQTLPGELFIIRNIANFVPPFKKSKEFLSTTSAIEYAINNLNVENIVLCGHSNCGGCKALYHKKEQFKELEHVKTWLKLGKDVKEKALNILEDKTDKTKRAWLTEQINIIEQIKNLLTYPFIKQLYEDKKIKIHGWYYVINTGEVFIYNKETQQFDLAN